MKRALNQSKTEIARYICLTCFLSSLLLNAVAQNWQFTQRYTPPDVKANHYFGGAVDIDGNFAIASARSQSSITNADTIKQAGAVYLFEKDAGSNWSETQKLTAPDASDFNYFGIDVGISGTTAVVGAHYNETDGDFKNPIPATGAVYVFERNQNGIWEFWQKLTASDRDTLDWFGKSLKLQQNQLIIAAPGVDEQEVQAVGSVYYFTKDQNGYWTEQQKITPPDKTAYKEFGTSIACNKNHMVIGAPFESDTVTNRNGIKLYQKDYGSAYIYQKQAGGIWAFAQKLISPADYSRIFGNSVGVCALNENETQILVGNPTGFNNNVDINEQGGAIFVYTTNDNEEWEWKDVILPRDTNPENLQNPEYRYYSFGAKFIVDSFNLIVPSAYVKNGAYNIGKISFYQLNTMQKWTRLQEIEMLDSESDIYYGTKDIAVNNNDMIIGEDKKSREPSTPFFLNTIAGNASFLKNNLMPFVEVPSVVQQPLIYPNPIGNSLRFNTSQFPNLKNIFVINAQGKNVYSNKVSRTPYQLTFKNPPGIYSIIVEDANGNLYNQKIIKTK